MTERSSASSATSSKSSAASSKSSASSAGSSKSSAGTSKSSATSSATGVSSSSSTTESDTTERSLSEIGGNTQASVSAATQYDTSVAQAVSAYAQSARNLQNYSIAGPMSKDQNKSIASAIKQIQNSSKMTADGGGVGSSSKPTGRRVLVMRHGERMDRLFPEWLQVAITDEGKYKPYDMNQPLMMIERVGGVGWAGYEHDSPITEMGNLSGQMVGRGLKNCRVDVKQVISSPALRCVQTANAILKAMENPDLKICIEPGMFEWLHWYDKMPQWFEPATLTQTGKYRINEMYKPVMSVSDVVGRKNESTKEYCERIANVTKQVLEQFKNPGTTLFVAHGSTMDVVGRSLMGKTSGDLQRSEMDQMGIYYPYCSIVALDELQGGSWKVTPSVLPQMTFLGFSNRFTPDYFNRA